ncbi:TPA: DUF2491 family protein [Pseudomonas aeruginosa]
MSWLKRTLGLEAPVANTLAPRERPLGLDNGKIVDIDPSLKLVLEGKVIQPLISGPNSLWSSGTITLGESHFLQRFYFDDNENWIQVHTTGSLDGQIESVILFNYSEAITVNSEGELARLAGPESDIGLPTYEFGGHTFAREWGSEEGQTALVPYLEAVITPNERYTVSHHAMLYARDTALPNRREFLLFSAEEDDEGAVTLTTSTGISLYTTDIKVTH